MTGLDPHRPKANVRAPGRLFLALLVIGLASLATPVAASAAQAVDVVFVLDNSGSMKTNDPSFLTRRAVADFADAISKLAEVDPRLGLVIFDSRVRLAQPLTAIGDSPSRDALTGVLGALDFSGQRTNSPAAIERAIYELRENGREEARKAIIFLSDGKIDTGDAQNDAEVARWLREDLAQESETSGIRIFGIAFTESADYQLMQALARRTGARYYRAFEATELSAVVGDLLARVDEAPSYDLAYIDEPTPLPTSFPDAGDPGRSGNSERSGDSGRSGDDPVAEPQSRMIGWLPIALLLVAALALAHRKRPFFGGSRARNSVDELGQSPPPAQLLDLSGLLGESGGSISLGPGRTTIGRDPHNDVSIADDTVSSEHAVIDVRDGVYWIQDRRSTNGTRLANKKLNPEQRYALKGGDRIRFADIDLMFVVEGYVPGGDTVYLSSSTTPPHGSSVYGGEPQPAAASRPAQPVQNAAADDVDVPSQEIVFAEARERLDPASVFDLDDELPSAEVAHPSAPNAEAGSDPEAVARADRALAAIPSGNSVDPEVAIFPSDEPSAGLDPMEAPTAEVVVPGGQAAAPAVPAIGPTHVDAKALGACLDYHLDRVAEISPDFATFVKRGFGNELRTALPIAAKELIEEAQQSGKIAQRAYTRDRIRYVLCGLPCDMNQAQAFFAEAFGGFTRVLSEQLRASSFRADRCEILALLSFGYGDAPWVSLSVVPDEGQTPRIDLLSYEFLTDQERTEIEPKSDPQISQSGLA